MNASNEGLTPVEASSSEEEGGFGPKEVVATILANWLLLASALLLGLLLASVHLYLTKPVYKSTASVLFETKSSEMMLAYGDAAGGLAASGFGATLAEMAIIQSQLVLTRVVQDTKSDIQVQPRYFPVIGEPLARRSSSLGQALSKLPGLRRYVWSAVDLQVPTLEVPQELEGRSFTLRALPSGKFDLFSGATALVIGAEIGKPQEVILNKESDAVLRIFVSELSAPAGAHFSVRRVPLSSAVRAMKGRLTIDEKPRGSGVIQITATSFDRKDAAKLANSVANAYLRQNVERRSAEAAKTLAFLKTQLPGVRSQLQQAESAVNAYLLSHSTIDLDKDAEFVLSESAEVERKRNELNQKRAELLLSLTAAHPAVKTIDMQLTKVGERSIRLDKAIAKLPETQQELLSLRREVEVNTNLYTVMLNNMQQLEVAEAGTLGNVRIIDDASVPGAPFKPIPLIEIVAGMIGGLVLGLLIIGLRLLLDHAEHDPTVIERMSGVPVYATIPFSRAEQKIFQKASGDDNGAARLLAIADPRDPAAEALRSLRTTLHFSVFESGRKSIMFTGPTPGIGKSFVTANLSAVLAQVPMKVILIDADLRRGTVHEYYGLTRGKGVSDYVLGASLDEVLRESSIPGLSLISTGEVPPNPSELLMSPRFQQLIAEAEERADLILVDSGPILAVTDAGIIGRLVGGTLMVFKAGQHSRREIVESVKRLTQVNVRVRGLVINQVGRGRGYGYYGYGKYGYYYSYGYKSDK